MTGQLSVFTGVHLIALNVSGLLWLLPTHRPHSLYWTEQLQSNHPSSALFQIPRLNPGPSNPAACVLINPQ